MSRSAPADGPAPATLRRRLREAWRRRLRHRPGPLPWLTWQPQRLLIAVLRALPERVSMSICAAVGRLAWLSARRRAAGRRHIRQAMPHRDARERDRILRRSCAHLGRSAAEILVFGEKLRGTWHERVRWEEGAREALEAERGRGAVVVQAHLGSVEIGGACAAHAGLAPAFVMRRPSNWYLARALVRAREGHGVELVPRQGAVRRLLACLRAGRAVLLATDQNAHHQPIFVDWFGRKAATERAAASLALRTGAAVLVSWCVRDGRGGWILGARKVHEARAPAHPTSEAEAELTGRMHRVMEEAVLRWPEQYLWIHDRYRTRPPEEAA